MRIILKIMQIKEAWAASFDAAHVPQFADKHITADKLYKVFARLFQKAARIQRRGALVARRNGRNSPFGIFFGKRICLQILFSFVPPVSKKKWINEFVHFNGLCFSIWTLSIT